MLDFAKDTAPRSKCFFTRTDAGTYVDEEAPPSKRKPFSTFLSHPFAHTIDVVLPPELFQLVEEALEQDALALRYSRVMMSLIDIISGDFFNSYIKKGNISMLSEGRRGIDNMFWLHEGILRLEVDRPTYERCGLQGEPIRDGGRKHIKSRFLIEINLRLPSMLHGKKGFGRIEWAFKNVLNHSLPWLFKDHESIENNESSAAPISTHHPFEKVAKPRATPRSNIRLPALKSLDLLAEPANAIQLYEWLNLLSLDSPRIYDNDRIDSFLSRYSVPDFENTENTHEVTDLVTIRWHGFITPQSISRIWLLCHKHLSSHWLAMNVGCFNDQAYTVFELGQQGTLTFDCAT